MTSEPKTTKQYGVAVLTALFTSAVFGYWQSSYAAGVFMFCFLNFLLGLLWK
jgi:hypothetical protein